MPSFFDKTLDIAKEKDYNDKCAENLGVAQLVARYLGVVEAAGSSPVTQTKKKHAKACFFGITTCSVVFDFSSKSDSFRLS